MTERPFSSLPALVDAAVRALAAVAAVTLVADALLGLVTGAVSSVGGGPSAPWWVAGHVLERSRWVVFALLLMALARGSAMRERLEAFTTPAGAWRLVGVLALVVPLAWMAASWIVQAVLFTVADRWDIDGQVLLSAGYYRQLFAGYAPWLLGGAASLVLSRHAS